MNKKMRISAFWVGLYLVLFSSAAMAASPFLVDFTPAENNSAVKALVMIFGQSVLDNSADAGLLGSMFKIFNLGALLFGTILVAYGSIVGTIATAHDGRLLGKQWSSAWVPVRIAGATALLVPSTNGLSMIQNFIMYVAIQGVGLGDATWMNGVTYMSKAASEPIVQAQISAMTPTTVRNILLSEACVRNMNKVMADAAAGNPDQPVPVFGHKVAPASGGKGLLANGIIATWGVVSGENSSYSATQCGSLTFTPPVSKNSQTAMMQIKMAAAHASTIIRLIDLSSAVADALVAVPPTMNSSQIDMAVQGLEDFYAAQLRASSIATVRDGDKAIRGQALQTLKDEGWLLAGKWFWVLGKANDEINAVSGSVPVYKSPAMGTLPKQVQNQVTALSIYSKEQMGVMERHEKSGADREAAMQDVSGGDADSLMSKAIAPVTEKVTWSPTKSLAEAFGIDGENRNNPIVQLKSVGDNIMLTTEAAYAAFVAGAGLAVAGLAAASGNIVTNLATGFALGEGTKAFISVVAPLVFTPISLMLLALWSFGAMLAVYLPLIPFITWITGVVSWLIIVIEAMVAAPLWAAMHMHPEGEGISGTHARQGYMLLLEVFSKPVLMVLGLASAMLIMYPIAWILNGSFFQAVNSIQQGTWTGFFSMVFFIAIYVTTSVALVQRAFSLIHLIPEKVPAWIGGMSRSADPAGELHAAKGGFGGVSGVATQAGSSGVGKISEGVAKAKKARAERMEKAAAAAAGGTDNAIHSAKIPGKE